MNEADATGLEPAFSAQVGPTQPGTDPYRLAIHLAPQFGWMNDPNGAVYFQGAYHLFYQFDPDQPAWNRMHWGHFRSTNLIDWEELPIALRPDQPYDADGCFSGSAVVDGDELVLFYTGHRWTDAERKGMIQVQCAARSRDGIHFLKDPLNPLITGLPVPTSEHVRDPKVWRHEDGDWRMVLGNRIEDIGRVVTMRSSDLKSWTYDGVMAAADRKQGYMWECPDWFRLEGQPVLLCSPQGVEPETERFRNLYSTGWLSGGWTEGGLYLPEGDIVELDHGFDFYAAQTMETPDGRRLLWAWMDMWENPQLTTGGGWAGAMTLPRELSLGLDGRVRMNPPAELAGLRTGVLYDGAHLDGEVVRLPLVEIVRGSIYELDTVWDWSGRTESLWTLHVHASAIEPGSGGSLSGVRVAFRKSGDELIVSMVRSRGIQGYDGERISRMKWPDDGLVNIRMFADRSSLELFVNKGGIVMTARIFEPADQHLLLMSGMTGGGLVKSLKVYGLRSIWSGPQREAIK